jgi:GT2 family glycosyltransferase/glycosyltransferase involved in cell wall biosynthesis
LWLGKIPFIPLYLTIVLTELFFWTLGCVRRSKRRWPALHSWSSGLSVIIPERGGGEMLHECLASVFTAAKEIEEPFEAIVVINGSPLSDYEQMRKVFPAVKWMHSHVPLGFSKAVRAGLRRARYDWVYLLNNDMIVDKDVLREVLPWRAPHIFAIASQIFFQDPHKRREETGWTDMRIHPDGICIFDVEPEDEQTVRGNLYAGGGASLFHKDLLQSLICRSDPYDPFYWEDVEWGVRAWRLGYETLFCPNSRAWHRHRATVNKFFQAEEIDRVFARNGVQFELRNMLDTTSPRVTVQRIRGMDRTTQLELSCLRNCAGLFVARIQASLAPFRDVPLQYVRRKFYSTPFSRRKADRTVVLVSPFAIYPPSHGGSVRMVNLIRELCQVFNVIILSDEEHLYDADHAEFFSPLDSVHLVGGRIENRTDRGRRIARIRSHSHRTMKAELARLVACYRPDIVQVEYMELGDLVRIGKDGTPWVLTLHDVLLSDLNSGPTEEDLFEQSLIAMFDGVFTCSPEDAGLLQSGKNYLVPNGTDLNVTYTDSRECREILFMGPFRYEPNFQGIRIFLETVYPELHKRIPDLRLRILGGNGAARMTEGFRCFDQSGIYLHSQIENVGPWLKACALTINPQYGTRGSSLKVLESIAHGRVCVSTRDGARGYMKAGLRGLVVVGHIEDFLHPLEELLLNEERRVSLEQPDLGRLLPFSWEHIGRQLVEVYNQHMK